MLFTGIEQLKSDLRLIQEIVSCRLMHKINYILPTSKE